MAGEAEVLLHRGSCICAHYELRITERCLADDLGLSADSSFDEALGHPIVQGFLAERSNNPLAAKTVGPEAGEKTVHRLARGHDHRGATWYDRRNGVVWLCAYRLHRSGADDDPFQIWPAFIREKKIQPTKDDYDRFGKDRVRRLVELGPDHGEAAVKVAVEHIGEVQAVNLAGQVQVRLVASHVDEFLEVTISFSSAGLNHERMMFIVRCFAGQTEDMWENVDHFEGEPLPEGDVAFKVWREA
jgi:hypothetical protein